MASLGVLSLPCRERHRRKLLAGAGGGDVPSTHHISLPPGHGYPEGLAGGTRLRLLAYFQDVLDGPEPASFDRVGELFRDKSKRNQAGLLMQAASVLTAEAYAHVGRAHGPVSGIAMFDLVSQVQPRLPSVDVDELVHSLTRISRSPDDPPMLRLHGAAHEMLTALGLLTSQAALVAAAAHPHAPQLKANATAPPAVVVRLAKELIAELDQALAESPTATAVLVTGTREGPETAQDADRDAAARDVAAFSLDAVMATGFVLLPLSPDPHAASPVSWSAAGVPAFVFRAQDEPDIAELLAQLRGGQAHDADSSASWQVIGTAEDFMVRLQVRWTAPVRVRLNLVAPGAQLAGPAREALAASDVVAVVPWPGGSPPDDTTSEEYLANALIVRVERFHAPGA
jgi:hypothetical protein